MSWCDEDCQEEPPPARRWTLLGLAIELVKPVIGVIQAAHVVTFGFVSMCDGIHGDMTAHYNWSQRQNEFRDAVVRDLESL